MTQIKSRTSVVGAPFADNENNNVILMPMRQLTDSSLREAVIHELFNEVNDSTNADDFVMVASRVYEKNDRLALLKH